MASPRLGEVTAGPAVSAGALQGSSSAEVRWWSLSPCSALRSTSGWQRCLRGRRQHGGGGLKGNSRSSAYKGSPRSIQPGFRPLLHVNLKAELQCEALLHRESLGTVASRGDESSKSNFWGGGGGESRLSPPLFIYCTLDGACEVITSYPNSLCMFTTLEGEMNYLG